MSLLTFFLMASIANADSQSIDILRYAPMDNLDYNYGLIIGRIYVQGEDLNSYKPLEVIDYWKIDPKVLGNITDKNETVFLHHGKTMDLPCCRLYKIRENRITLFFLYKKFQYCPDKT